MVGRRRLQEVVRRVEAGRRYAGPVNRRHVTQSPPTRRRSRKGAENAETDRHIGLSRGGGNTKIHTVVDALGNPAESYLTPGNVNDRPVAVDVLSDVEIENGAVMGEKAYGTKEIRDHKVKFDIELRGHTGSAWTSVQSWSERHFF
jgi:hypothetical protein